MLLTPEDPESEAVVKFHHSYEAMPPELRMFCLLKAGHESFSWKRNKKQAEGDFGNKLSWSQVTRVFHRPQWADHTHAQQVQGAWDHQPGAAHGPSAHGPRRSA